MSGRASMLLMIAVCALATPAAAQAPTSTTTGFDGTYVGCHIHSRKPHRRAGTNLDALLLTGWPACNIDDC